MAGSMVEELLWCLSAGSAWTSCPRVSRRLSSHLSSVSRGNCTPREECGNDPREANLIHHRSLSAGARPPGGASRPPARAAPPSQRVGETLGNIHLPCTLHSWATKHQERQVKERLGQGWGIRASRKHQSGIIQKPLAQLLDGGYRGVWSEQRWIGRWVGG